MKFRIAFFIIACISLFTTCSYDVYNPDICFQQNVLPIFVSKCSTTGCHNATDHKAGYNLSNYDGIMRGVVPKHPLQSKNYTVISGINPSMPKGEKLSTKEVSYIKIWIRMGAKNSSNCSTGCDTSAFTYGTVIKPLLSIWCVGCHNSNNKGGGFDLSSYIGVKACITQGRFLGTIKHSSGFNAMPLGTDKLNDCDITKIQKWINAGYLNN
jgi:hypothetical protein